MKVTLYYDDKAFGTAVLPAVKAKAGVTNRFAVGSTVTVTDRDVFNAFSEALLTRDSLAWRIHGSATVSLAGFPLTVPGVDFDKEVVIRASGNFSASTIEQFSLADSTENQVVAQATVRLWNGGITGLLGIGRLCVDVEYEGGVLGRLSNNNATLLPGWNELELTGPLQDSDKSATNDLISAFLAGVSRNITAKGTPCPGSAPLFDSAIQLLQLRNTLPGAPYPMIRAMTVEGMALEPQSDASLRLALNATVTLNCPLGQHSPMVVETIAMNATMVGAGEPLGAFVVPETPVPPPPPSSSHNPASPVVDIVPVPTPFPSNVSLVLTANVSLDDGGTSFGDFVERFLHAPSVPIAIVSDAPGALRATIRTAMGVLSLDVPLQASATMEGVDGFRHVVVDGFDVLGATPNGSALLVSSRVNLFNPSPVALPMGHAAVFGVHGPQGVPSVPPVRLGSMVMADVVLQPGWNALVMNGTLAPPPGELDAASLLFSNYLGGLDTSVTVVGESVQEKGGLPTPSWLQRAVRNITVATALPGYKNLTLLTGVQFDSLSFSFPPGEAAPPVMGGTVQTQVHLPFTNVPFSMNYLNVTLELAHAEGEAPFARNSLTFQRAHYVPDESIAGLPQTTPPRVSGNMTIFLDPAPMTVLNDAAFAEFVRTLEVNTKSTLFLRVHASQSVHVPIGNLTVQNLTLLQQVELPGMDSYSLPPIQVVQAAVAGVTNTSALFDVSMRMFNPSVVSVALGPVVLDMVFNDTVLGQATIADLALVPGWNNLTAQGTYIPADPVTDPVAAAAGREFVSRYVTRRASEVQFRGSRNSTVHPLLQPAMEALVTNASVPGLTEVLITEGIMDVFKLDGGDMDGQIGLNNPTAVELAVLDSKLQVLMCADETKNKTCTAYGDEISLFTNKDLWNDPILIPNNSHRLSDPRPFQLLGNLDDTLKVLWEIIDDGGSAPTRVQGNLTLRLGGAMVVVVDYYQDDIPLHVTLSSSNSGAAWQGDLLRQPGNAFQRRMVEAHLPRLLPPRPSASQRKKAG